MWQFRTQYFRQGPIADSFFDPRKGVAMTRLIDRFLLRLHETGIAPQPCTLTLHKSTWGDERVFCSSCKQGADKTESHHVHDGDGRPTGCGKRYRSVAISSGHPREVFKGMRRIHPELIILMRRIESFYGSDTMTSRGSAPVHYRTEY